MLVLRKIFDFQGRKITMNISDSRSWAKWHLNAILFVWKLKDNSMKTKYLLMVTSFRRRKNCTYEILTIVEINAVYVFATYMPERMRLFRCIIILNIKDLYFQYLSPQVTSKSLNTLVWLCVFFYIFHDSIKLISP